MVMGHGFKTGYNPYVYCREWLRFYLPVLAIATLQLEIWKGEVFMEAWTIIAFICIAYSVWLAIFKED
jgi:hypothetical protein